MINAEISTLSQIGKLIFDTFYGLNIKRTLKTWYGSWVFCNQRKEKNQSFYPMIPTLHRFELGFLFNTTGDGWTDLALVLESEKSRFYETQSQFHNFHQKQNRQFTIFEIFLTFLNSRKWWILFADCRESVLAKDFFSKFKFAW